MLSLKSCRSLPSISSKPSSPMSPPRSTRLELDETRPAPPNPKLSKGSAQLNRWSRVRTLRSGRRLPRTGDRKDRLDPADDGGGSSRSGGSSGSGSSPTDEEEEEEEGRTTDEEEEGEGNSKGKVIYMVSDATGSTVENAVNSALGQFEYCLVDRVCAVNTHLFSGIDDLDRLLDIIKQAAKDNALFLYTLVDPSMSEPAKQACRLWGVPFVDILRPTTDAIASHLGVEPSGIRRSERKVPLSDAYFKRIEAIDFTIKQDDGAQPQNLNKANIVLVGVSRTGKTPLSIYLAQKGYRVANVPIVMGVELPKILFEINQEKVFGLTINPVILQTIRKTRAKTLGFNREMEINYSEMDHVRQELEFASRIYAQNPMWPVIEVTGRAVEETAAIIVRTYHDRKKKCSMPSISRRY